MNASLEASNSVEKRRLWLFALTGLCVYGITLLFQPRQFSQRILVGQNDFMQLYIGATLTGSEAIYSRSENERLQVEFGGFQSDSIRYSRPPFYSVLLRPLTLLPYRAAYWVFQTVSVVAFLLFLRLFVPGCTSLAAFASLSIPLFATLQNGQDVTLALLFAGLGVFLARRNLDFLAGLALSLCAIKFHLFMLVPLILVAQRRWRVLLGGLTGGLILFGLSFYGGGRNWIQAYLEALRDGDLHPDLDRMPNLHTFSSVLSGRPAMILEVALGVLVIAVTVGLAVKLKDFEHAFAFALIGSLLVSIHSYTQDCLILLLPLAIVIAKPPSGLVKNLTELAVSPIPYFFLLAGVPLNLAVPCLFMAILGAAMISVQAQTGPPPAPQRWT